MTRATLFFLMAGLALWTGAQPCRAAEPSPQARQAIEATRRDNPALKLQINPATGLVTSIRGLRPSPPPLAAAAPGEPNVNALRSAFENFFNGNPLTAAVNPNRTDSIVESQPGFTRDPDIPGQYIVRGSQRVKGIPVFGSDASTVMDGAASVLSATANISPVRMQDTTATVPEVDAIAAARAKINDVLSRSRGPQPFGPSAAAPVDAPATATLMIFDPAIVPSKGQVQGEARLAYLVAIDTYRLFVDAKTSEVFYYFQARPTAAARRVFDLKNGLAFPGARIIDEQLDQEHNNLAQDGELAFIFAGVVQDYFYLNHRRRSIGDSTRLRAPQAGGPAPVLESFIRYGNEKNAWWCPQIMQGCPRPDVMVYGPGFAGALDIVAHEMTHGVIIHEADLIYADESGAINEGLADIFGTLVEFYFRNDAGNWTIGESLPGGVARDMANPHMKTAAGVSRFNAQKSWSSDNNGQPDSWTEFVKRQDPLCAQLWLEDSGCVHINSGILNKMAYLIAEGGTHNETVVVGIGKAKLARIAYRTLTVHLGSQSGFHKTASAFHASCEELAAARRAGITATDCAQVQQAIIAVGLDLTSS